MMMARSNGRADGFLILACSGFKIFTCNNVIKHIIKYSRDCEFLIFLINKIYNQFNQLEYTVSSGIGETRKRDITLNPV